MYALRIISIKKVVKCENIKINNNKGKLRRGCYFFSYVKKWSVSSSIYL